MNQERGEGYSIPLEEEGEGKAPSESQRRKKKWHIISNRKEKEAHDGKREKEVVNNQNRGGEKPSRGYQKKKKKKGVGLWTVRTGKEKGKRIQRGEEKETQSLRQKTGKTIYCTKKERRRASSLGRKSRKKRGTVRGKEGGKGGPAVVDSTRKKGITNRKEKKEGKEIHQEKILVCNAGRKGR